MNQNPSLSATNLISTKQIPQTLVNAPQQPAFGAGVGGAYHQLNALLSPRIAAPHGEWGFSHQGNMAPVIYNMNNQVLPPGIIPEQLLPKLERGPSGPQIDNFQNQLQNISMIVEFNELLRTTQHRRQNKQCKLVEEWEHP